MYQLISSTREKIRKLPIILAGRLEITLELQLLPEARVFCLGVLGHFALCFRSLSTVLASIPQLVKSLLPPLIGPDRLNDYGEKARDHRRRDRYE
jgi:hypothetical protein